MSTATKTARRDAGLPASLPAVEDAEELLEAVGDETHRVWFYRMREGVAHYLGAVEPAKLRAPGVREYARSRWGGGQFRAKIRGTNGQWGKSRQFAVEGEPRRNAPEEPTGTAAAAPIAAAGGAHELPSWVEKIIVPLGVTLAGALANKLLADPKTDPLVLELIKLQAKGASSAIDPVELQKLVADAERRGEERGRELGELTARGNGLAEATGTSGVVDAIREAAPLVSKLLDRGAPAREIPPPPALLPAATAAPTTAPMPAADIVPVWLRSFIKYKGFLIDAADRGSSVGAIAGLVIENATDTQWADIDQAERAGRLEADLYAALPELRGTSARQQFATALLGELTAALEADRRQTAKAAAAAAKPTKKAAAAGAAAGATDG